MTNEESPTQPGVLQAVDSRFRTGGFAVAVLTAMALGIATIGLLVTRALDNAPSAPAPEVVALADNPPTTDHEPEVLEAQAEPKTAEPEAPVAAQEVPEAAPPANPKPAKQAQQVASLTLPFGFNANMLEISATQKKALGGMAKTCTDKVHVVGHTCAVGTPSANKAVGLARAQAVARELKKRGVPDNRLKVSTAGSKVPIASNDTEAGRRENRRVTVECRP